MKQITTLNLKEDTEMYVQMHSSCIIDKKFLKKCCKKRDPGEQRREVARAVRRELGTKVDKRALPLLQKNIDDSSQIEMQQSVRENSPEKEEANRRSLKKKGRKNEEEGERAKRVEVMGIEIDSIFVGEESKLWLRALSNSENMDIFSIMVVQAIILFQWKYFKRTIILRMLLPFLAYFLLFVLYSTLMLPNKALETSWGPWSTGSLVLSIFILLMAVYMSYIEVMQMKFHGFDYFTSFWNVADLISLVLNLITVISDLAGM